jgi:hypothetical protein
MSRSSRKRTFVRSSGFSGRNMVGHLTPCLEDVGYATTPPPPVEEFVGSYSGGRPWTPWPVNDARLQDEAEWYRLNEVCPQSPSLEYLYGDAVSPDGD